MYESAFGFRLRPFAAAPTPALHHPVANFEKARAALVRCIEHGGAPGLIVGPAGVGKSLLCQMLADQFRSRFRVAMLASARLCTRRALLQNILFELGLPYRDLEEGELRLSLIDYLANDERAAQGMLLIVDEAHSLPTRLLEEIRMITNLMRDGKPRVRLILAGNARLEERFASPKLESFNQRIASRCYLESLGREETKGYIRSQLAAAGGPAEEVFTDDATSAVYDATGGVPRLINQVCDHALVLASVGETRRIDATGIQEAWSDLQQLPAPWHMESASQASVVEFGRLDEAEDAVRPAAGGQAPAAAARPDPLEQLSEIEESVAVAASQDAGASWTAAFSTDRRESAEEEQFQPAGVVGPEVELVFHGPHAPFGDSFVEEEVVIDRYAALESARLAKLRQSPWSRDRKIPERLAEAEDRLHAGPANSGAPDDMSRTIVIEPASDPVMPEYGDASEAAAEDAAELVAFSGEDEAAPAGPKLHDPEFPDDRDLIVVEDDSEPGPAGPRRPTGRVRRQEYRQLFARMRRGS